MKKDRLSTFLLIVMIVIGLSLLLYPSVSDYWNSMHQSYAVATYIENVADIDDDKYKEMWELAFSFNKKLSDRENKYVLTDEQREEYRQLFNVGGNGIMGYIEVPSIDISLPIYHGVDEAVLQVAIGHLEWTSLPTGGAGTHCVVSGHRGLPSARLFTDLDQLVVGDLFMLYILDEVLTYEVDQIRIVEPHETQELLIQEGKDLCTLVTCTPYGVNSHRLLVRGHRVENLKETQTVRVTADAMTVEPVIVASFLAVPLLLMLLLILLIEDRRKRMQTYKQKKKQGGRASEKKNK